MKSQDDERTSAFDGEPETRSREPGDTTLATPTTGSLRGTPISATRAALDAEFSAGTLLADRYRIVRLLGRGGMGVVYHADDLTLEVPVALKFLSASHEGDRAKLELFLNEARLARQIAHPNVCRVYDVGQVDELYFLSMEYIEGENLSSLLKRIGRLGVDRALALGLDICHGLAAAHERGILHRDLKPANLMIDEEGRARITDFGLAWLAGKPRDSQVVAGTPVYMAPEQAQGEASVQSDLYALGLVLYELFTGERAFSKPRIFLGEDVPPPPLEVKNLDPGVAHAVLSCLELDPQDRPKDVGFLTAAFEQGAAPPWHAAAGIAIPHRTNWVLREKLGEGGFGEAWLAVHKKTREQRVFKFCHDVAKLRTFQREITLFRLLKEQLGQRDDITSILDWSLESPPYFIEAEHTAGGNLRRWMEERGGIEAVPLEERLEIVAQVATALAAAHSVGVMHKDVKPSNILIKDDGNGPPLGETEGGRHSPRAQLCDFGIGSLTEQTRLEEVGITVLGLTESESRSSPYGGTRLYMAPEVLEGRGATQQADVYSLGVVLYQIVVGDFSRALAPGWDRDIDDDLLAADIAAAVEGSSERRLASAQLAKHLRSLGERRAQRTEAERLRQEAALARNALERTRQRKKWVALALSVLVVIAVILVLAFEEGESAARTALVEHTLEAHQGMARITAAAVDRNLAAVERRVERAARDPAFRALMNELRDVPSVAGQKERRAQALTDGLYESYKDRHFYSWVLADENATARARSPFDEVVVGNNYGYREWFTGTEEAPPSAEPTRPRDALGLTLAFQSTAEGHPILMSVAAPILAENGEDVLGVLAATLHLVTFNEWLSVPEGKADSACPERFVLLLHRGQLLRHPCPEPEAPQPPVDRVAFASTAVVERLLGQGSSRDFRDPLRPRAFSGRRGDLAVAASLPSYPDWTVVVVQDRAAALRPLTRLTGRFRRLGQIALAVVGLVLAVLMALLWRWGAPARPGR